MADTLTLLADMDAVFCSRLGLGPWQKLEEAGVQPVVDYAWQPIREALSAWWQLQPKGTEVKLHVRGVA
jgi:nitrogen fixation protein NifB